MPGLVLAGGQITRAVVGLALGLMLAAPAPASAAAGALKPGKATFWQGPTVASGNVEDPSLCGTPAGDCQTYTLRLAATGARLRVALDTPMRSDSFRFDLIDPSGASVA